MLFMKKNKNLKILLGLLLLFLNMMVLPVQAALPQPYSGFTGKKLPSDSYELIYGDESAPITVVEYTALTCAHCAQFHQTVMPEIRKKYIDTGRVRFIFRHFPIDKLSLKATAIVNTLPVIKRMHTIEQIFAQQEHWMGAGDKAVEKLALICQLPSEKCYQVIQNQTKLDESLQSRLDIEKVVPIEGTPTFFINDKMYPMALTLAEFDQIVANESKNLPTTVTSAYQKP